MAPPLRACTTFCLVDANNVIFGRNFDYYVPDGRVTVNRRGLLKTGYGGGSGTHWISRFGNVTFNQFGCQFPNGGMNDAGLVVEMMMLVGSQYPSDTRPGLEELQWIQYQLDCSATVDDVLASDRVVRILPGSTPLHYLIADRTGRAAVIEFLGGERICHVDDTLAVAALTNSTYDESLAFAAMTTAERADHLSSLGRFVQAAASVLAFPSSRVADPVGYAFAALANVNQPGFTQWSIVYDVGRRRVHFRTLRATTIKSIGLDELDFRPTAPALVMDMNSTVAGEVTPNAIYSSADNLTLITTVYQRTPPLASVSSAEMARRAAYPDSIREALPPSVRAHPLSQTVVPAGAATLTVSAAGDGPLTYAWRKNGVTIPGATGAEFVISDLTAADSGDYTVVVTNPVDSTASRFARVVVATPEPGRLSNMSVRATAGSDGQPLIVGFVMKGGTKRLLVRAVGPSLGTLFSLPGVLADPRLEVHLAGGLEDRVVGSNDNWGENALECDVLARLCTSVGAFPLSITSRDAALAIDVEGARTVHVSGAPGSTSGVALVEAYDAGTGNSPRLVNLSTRNQVGTGANALFAGFVINGNSPKRLLVRGIGPSLTSLFGVPNALADPRLELHATINGWDVVFATNDDWEAEPGAAAAAAGVAAFGLPAGSKDAALVVTLPAGIYSAVVTGANGATGNALVEVYDSDP